MILSRRDAPFLLGSSSSGVHRVIGSTLRYATAEMDPGDSGNFVLCLAPAFETEIA